jgi:hypothetical protein
MLSLVSVRSSRKQVVERAFSATAKRSILVAAMPVIGAHEMRHWGNGGAAIYAM